MHLWIDNTGLHGAGRSLIGEAKTAYDLKGLLQLSTLLVFADRVQLGNFEPSEIASTSERFLSIIRKSGMEDNALGIRNTSKESYAAACTAAAQFAAEELLDRFAPDQQLINSVPQRNIPRGAQFDPARTERLARIEVSADLQRMRESALDRLAAGAIDFMLLSSPPLRRAVSALMDEHADWSAGHTFQVESMLRAYLNEQLAAQTRANYAPAAHRADVIARENRWIIDQISDALDPIVNERRREPLGIPSIIEALIRKSKGEPSAVITEALEMRRKSESLRAALLALQRASEADGPRGEHQIRKEVADLARGVQFDLALKSFWDAVIWEVPLGGRPKAKGSAKDIADWVRLRMQRRQRVVLTDVVLSAAYSGIDDAVYRKLIRRSFGGRPSLETLTHLKLGTRATPAD
jgi:hypothetical protein